MESNIGTIGTAKGCSPTRSLTPKLERNFDVYKREYRKQKIGRPFTAPRNGPPPNRAECQNPQGGKAGLSNRHSVSRPSQRVGSHEHLRIIDARMSPCMPLYGRPWMLRFRAARADPQDR